MEKLTVEEYNSIPVYYCRNCLSLKIIELSDSIDYCDKCGSTEINTTSIEEWEKLYQKKYGKPFNEKEDKIVKFKKYGRE